MNFSNQNLNLNNKTIRQRHFVPLFEEKPLKAKNKYVDNKKFSNLYCWRMWLKMEKVLLVVSLLIILTLVALGIFATGIAREDGETVRLSLSFGAFWLLLCIVIVFYLKRARPEITP